MKTILKIAEFFCVSLQNFMRTKLLLQAPLLFIILVFRSEYYSLRERAVTDQGVRNDNIWKGRKICGGVKIGAYTNNESNTIDQLSDFEYQ